MGRAAMGALAQLIRNGTVSMQEMEQRYKLTNKLSLVRSQTVRGLDETGAVSKMALELTVETVMFAQSPQTLREATRLKLLPNLFSFLLRRLQTAAMTADLKN